MGLLSAALGGLIGDKNLGANGLLGGFLPAMMQQGGDKKEGAQPGFGDRLQSLMSSPSFANNMSMMATGEPSLGGFGGAPQQPPPLAPPQMPPQQTPDNSLMSAFGGSPQFQQQLGGIMNGQGPGMQAPIFTPPQTPMSQAPPLGQRSNQGNSFFDRMRQFRSQQF